MEGTRRAATCRWAVPTLFLREPLWLAAWDSPWTCVRDPERPRPLVTTEECASCPHWEEQTAEPRDQDRPEGAMRSSRARDAADPAQRGGR
jgi:hypothetical protein